MTFAEPAVDDFGRWIRFHLATAEKRMSAQYTAVERKAVARGMFAQVGMINDLFEVARPEFDKGITKSEPRTCNMKG